VEKTWRRRSVSGFLATDGSHISQYDAATTRAILGETAVVLRAFGFAGSHAIVIGGLVPTLLVPIVDPGVDPHIGTTDVDLCLSVALSTGNVGAYQRLEAALRQADFHMKPLGPASASSWQWVGGKRTALEIEFFCAPTADNLPGQLYRPDGDVTHGVSAMTLAAGRLVDRDNVERDIPVVLPDLTEVVVPFRVTGAAAYVATKIDALRRREKNKDAYDMVWMTESWPGGPPGFAQKLLRSPVLRDPEFQAMLGNLPGLFETLDSLGSRRFATFVSREGEDRDVAARRASGAVGALLAELHRLGAVED